MKRIQVAISSIGARVFRNQVGSYKLHDGTHISSGLCVGSSDLIGWVPRVITPDMVGKTIAIFTAIEVKAVRGKLTKEQEKFLDAVDASGGIAVVARSVDEALRGVSGKGEV